jgi:hypothetical protein
MVKKKRRGNEDNGVEEQKKRNGAYFRHTKYVHYLRLPVPFRRSEILLVG